MRNPTAKLFVINCCGMFLLLDDAFGHFCRRAFFNATSTIFLTLQDFYGLTIDIGETLL